MLLIDLAYWCSLIGAMIIAIGFYAVIWGQAQEEKMIKEKNEILRNVSSSSAVPFLQNSSMDV